MFTKEPTEILDYEIDWSDWLGTLTISTSVWIVPSGITQVAEDHTPSTTLSRFSGGTWGQIYELSNTITANNSESETRSILIRIQRSVAYCTPIEVRRRAFGGLGQGASATVNSLPAAELESLIEQVSRMFDQQCGLPEGWFNPVAIPIPIQKTIYGDGTNYLKLPPYIPGTLDTNLILPTDYTTPMFTEQNGYLVVNSNGFLPPFRYGCSGWQKGMPIVVSAVWGYLETPADVKAMVIEWVLNLFRETDPANIKLINLDNQPLRESMPPRVAMVAKKYRGREAVLV